MYHKGTAFTRDERQALAPDGPGRSGIADDLRAGALFPPVQALRWVSARIAAAVGREAREAGLGRPIPDDAIPEAVAAARWEPAYLPVEPA